MGATVYEIITSRIIDALEKGVVPWRREWDASKFQPPRNLNTGKVYGGINFFILGLLGEGFSSPYWLTFKQARDRGAHVRKGEKGAPVFFWKVYGEEKNDGEESGGADRRFVARYYTVFNAEQCEGLDHPRPEPRPAVPANDLCERIVAGYSNHPEIHHGGDAAFYSPIGDVVQMPQRDRFHSSEAYYATLFHELTHSTGHPKRLARFSPDAPPAPFGSEDYSREELVAEMGAAFVCAHAGISNATIDNAAGYIDGWLRTMRQDTRAVVFAAAAARKAADHILGAAAADEDGG